MTSCSIGCRTNARFCRSVSILRRPWGQIYKARSKATHVGEAFPISALYTGGPSIDARAASMLFRTEEAFPPVVWFERIVHSALSGFSGAFDGDEVTNWGE